MRSERCSIDTAAQVNSVASSRHTLLAVIAGALAISVYVLISIGGLVRNAGAGLSCPDWPLCFGKLVPSQLTSGQVFIEWFHRLIAGAAGFVLLGISSFIFFNAALRPKLWKVCVLALGLLVIQVVLGGLTVIGLLSPKWVVSHLAVGMAFFGTVLILTLKLRDESLVTKTRLRLNPRVRFQLSCFGFAAVCALYIQIILGGMVSSNYAGLACPDFPTCQGQWVPDLNSLVALQFAHRVGALISTVIIVFFLSKLVRLLPRPRSTFLNMILRAAPLLLMIQIILGAGMVFLKIPLLMSVSHLAIAAALLATLLVMMYEIQHSRL